MGLEMHFIPLFFSPCEQVSGKGLGSPSEGDQAGLSSGTATVHPSN